jgi:hypothetical protein
MTVAVSSSGMRDMLVAWTGAWIKIREVEVMGQGPYVRAVTETMGLSLRQAQGLVNNYRRQDRRDVP